MNSWKSRLLSACLPPLSTFIIGTGRRTRADAAEVGVERQAAGGCRGARAPPCDTPRMALAPEPRLVRRAVERDQRLVDGGLSRGVAAAQRRGDLAVDVRDGLEHALAEVALRVAVAQLDRLVLAGGGARGDGRCPLAAIREDDPDADGGKAAGIEDLVGTDRLDLGLHHLLHGERNRLNSVGRPPAARP